jgi:hypothetical protein
VLNVTGSPSPLRCETPFVAPVAGYDFIISENPANATSSSSKRALRSIFSGCTDVRNSAHGRITLAPSCWPARARASASSRSITLLSTLA